VADAITHVRHPAVGMPVCGAKAGSWAWAIPDAAATCPDCRAVAARNAPDDAPRAPAESLIPRVLPDGRRILIDAEDRQNFPPEFVFVAIEYPNGWREADGTMPIRQSWRYERWNIAGADLQEAERRAEKAEADLRTLRAKLAETLFAVHAVHDFQGTDEELLAEVAAVCADADRKPVVPPTPDGMVDVRLVVAVDEDGRAAAAVSYQDDSTGDLQDDEAARLEALERLEARSSLTTTSVVLLRVPAPKPAAMPVIDLRGGPRG
jgi:hypothetical protein